MLTDWYISDYSANGFQSLGNFCIFLPNWNNIYASKWFQITLTLAVVERSILYVILAEYTGSTRWNCFVRN